MRKKLNHWQVAAAVMACVFLSTTFYLLPVRAETAADIHPADREPGWHRRQESWYFHYPLPGERFGQPVTGWQWIDGYCYYFFESGQMAAGTVTPDGYPVADSGAWLENGQAVYCPGRGILSFPLVVGLGETVREAETKGGGTGGGSGGGSPGGGGSGSGGSGGGEQTPPQSPEEGREEPVISPEDKPGHNTGPEQETESEQEEEAERLKQWVELAGEADFAITQIENHLVEDYLIRGKTENDRRIKSLISMISDGQWYEFYMIGMDYQADPLIIGQIFHDSVRYSHLVLDTFTLDGVFYTISRIRVQKIQTTESGQQDDKIPAQGMYYSYGDTVVKKIGREHYRFRCIEEDYQDAQGNRQGLALFLCETVIRSDVDSQEGIRHALSFGEDNNYKKSSVRRWLLDHGSAVEGEPVFCGVNLAFEGMTGQGDFSQLDEEGLEEYEIPFQKQHDDIFLLSVEEAMRYGDELWRFAGSLAKNPESQYSPYSKGYYLRTPRYETGEDGAFCYGSGIYMVDLLDGCIRPVSVTSVSVGIRPAFALPNG